MLFTSPSYAPSLPQHIPDSIPVGDFVLAQDDSEAAKVSKNPFTCGLSGRTYTAEQVRSRVDHLARSLSAELGWAATTNSTEPTDRTVGIFSLNTIDSMTASWAAHRLSGVCSMINAGYSESECVKQLAQSKCQALFTCVPLLTLALQCAAKANIPEKHVYILEVPKETMKGVELPTGCKTVDQLIVEGATYPPLPPLAWSEGRGAQQVAFLCASSGTSGLPKLVMISHKNIIANILQLSLYENTYRSATDYQTCLGLLPQSHSFALIMMCHYAIQRGDGLLVMPGFDMQQMLRAIQQHRVNRLYMVPPMVVAMVRVPKLLARYDLSSVSNVVVGASNLSEDLATSLSEMKPGWKIMQGYGLTETSVVVSITSPNDISFGSVGSLLPGYEARILGDDGQTLSGHGKPGELVLRSPSIMLGYLDNEEETSRSFIDGDWLRTGDLVEMRQSALGHDHLVIVDRIKELIKVKGMQVAPAELEALLCLHPAVQDAAVVAVPHSHAGELPKAMIVRSKAYQDADETQLKDEIKDFVKDRVAYYKQLAGGIEFVATLPRNAAGKLLRRVLRESIKQEDPDRQGQSSSKSTEAKATQVFIVPSIEDRRPLQM